MTVLGKRWCGSRLGEEELKENKPGFLKEGRGLPIIGEAPAGEFAGRVMVQGMLGL